ncbi:MAG: hypothetical protein DRR19_05780 [Candidatus Parabeggiatoa sp. nov. 1]|nr:MAG: hypothetical protein DRR19_05780 [Gammaproteobacteria bacterium]
MLTGLDTTAGYERCLTLGRLGLCFRFQGQTEVAATYYQQELDELEELEQSKSVLRERSIVYTSLADVLTDMGRYADAQAVYEQSLAIKNGDQRGEAVVQGQLGNLALFQGKLAEARYFAINEPSHEAIYLHQLGMKYQIAKQWEAAEKAYRKSANIEEAQGNLSGAIQTWIHLGILMQTMDKLVDAEQWYRKAIIAI